MYRNMLFLNLIEKKLKLKLETGFDIRLFFIIKEILILSH